MKSFRKQIHAIALAIILLDQTRETVFATSELKLAKAWAGKYLGTFGEPTPYPQSSNPGSPVIEDEADESDRFPFSGDNRTANIKEARAVINKLLSNHAEFPTGRQEYEQISVHLQQANFWLGFELGNIRVGVEPVPHGEAVHLAN